MYQQNETTMEIKKNYFLRNMVDLEKSFAEYLSSADFNYVILEKNIPLVWASDKTPVIYGGEIDVLNELVEIGAFEDENMSILKPDFKVMTELDFIVTFCLDAVADYIAKKIITYGEFDGTNFVLNTDDSFNGIIDYHGMTDILGIYVSNDSKSELTFFVSNDKDTNRDFLWLNYLPNEVIVKIVQFVEKTYNNEY